MTLDDQLPPEVGPRNLADSVPQGQALEPEPPKKLGKRDGLHVPFWVQMAGGVLSLDDQLPPEVDLRKLADSVPQGQEPLKKLDKDDGLNIPLWVWIAGGALLLVLASSGGGGDEGAKSAPPPAAPPSGSEGSVGFNWPTD